MKVLHIETGMNLYGGARQVQYLLAGLAAHGVENVLATAAGSAIEGVARESGVTVETVPSAGDLDLRLVSRLGRIIRTHDPDLVHLHSRRGADIMGALAARRCSVPVVLSRRVDSVESRLVAGLKYRLYDRVVAISGGIARQLQQAGVAADKIACVRSAVDEAEWRQPCDREAWRREFGIADGSPVLAVVAQLTERKAHGNLFAALPAILATQPDVRVLCFGRGPMLDRLDQELRATGMNRVVTMAGFRPDLPRWLGCADLLVHPALREGLGIAVLQAASAGLAVVASRAGGIPEAVVHEQTGLLVPPGDVAGISDAVIRLLQDDALRHRMGKAGQAHVQAHFSLQSMVAGNLAVYRDLLGENFT